MAVCLVFGFWLLARRGFVVGEGGSLNGGNGAGEGWFGSRVFGSEQAVHVAGMAEESAECW